jgi:hypothetical protein
MFALIAHDVAHCKSTETRHGIHLNINTKKKKTSWTLPYVRALRRAEQRDVQKQRALQGLPAPPETQLSQSRRRYYMNCEYAADMG